jgi:hypothetical protein
MFSLPTVEKNAVNYFREAGVTLLCDWSSANTMGDRISTVTFDTRLSIYAALSHIRKIAEDAGAEPPHAYCIAHCVGAIGLAAGLLDGSIPGEWIKGITASSVFMSPNYSHTDYLKSMAPVGLNDVYGKLISNWFGYLSKSDDGILQWVLNQALRLFPVEKVDEFFQSLVCHRASLGFGR